MSGFSAQEISSITLDDSFLTDNITITNSSYYASGSITIPSGSNAGYTIGTGINGVGAIDTITLNGINATSFTWSNPEEFVDCLPEINRIKDMCDTYPGLKIAYEKFVTTYKLVKDDYDNPNKEKP